MTQEQRDEMKTIGIEPCISCLPGRRTITILERVLCGRLAAKGEEFGCNKYFRYHLLGFVLMRVRVRAEMLASTQGMSKMCDSSDLIDYICRCSM